MVIGSTDIFKGGGIKCVVLEDVLIALEDRVFSHVFEDEGLKPPAEVLDPGIPVDFFNIAMENLLILFRHQRSQLINNLALRNDLVIIEPLEHLLDFLSLVEDSKPLLRHL